MSVLQYSETKGVCSYPQVKQINVNDFLETTLEDPGPECLAWLPLLHRLAASESGKVLPRPALYIDVCTDLSFFLFKFKRTNMYHDDAHVFLLGVLSLAHLCLHAYMLIYFQVGS